MSWDERFSECYDDWSAAMTEDVPFYVRLAREAEADGPLVELAVGNGRVAVPVALATGREVIGIDASPSMLEQAGRAAAGAGVSLDLRLADMRDFELEEPAALIYCPFRALLHLPTWADRRRTFERVAASLRPGARFAWNVLPSTTRSQCASTAIISPSRCPTRCATPSATTASTSCSTAAARARSGGRPRTSGSG